MSCMGCCGVMAVVLAAFDDSMKEVLALVNKTAYNITLACMSCVAYSLSWQLSTCGYCLIKHFAGAESARACAHTRCLVLWWSGNVQLAGRDSVAMQTRERGKDEKVFCNKLTVRVGWGGGGWTIFHLCPDHLPLVHFSLKTQLNWEQMRRQTKWYKEGKKYIEKCQQRTVIMLWSQWNERVSAVGAVCMCDLRGREMDAISEMWPERGAKEKKKKRGREEWWKTQGRESWSWRAAQVSGGGRGDAAGWCDTGDTRRHKWALWLSGRCPPTASQECTQLNECKWMALFWLRPRHSFSSSW